MGDQAQPETESSTPVGAGDIRDVPPPSPIPPPPPRASHSISRSAERTLVFDETNLPTELPQEVLPGPHLTEQKLGPYNVTDFIGAGGTALVYSGTDPDGAPVALKVMNETPMLPADVLQRFCREADAAKKLRRHPNIVTVYDTGAQGTNHYIVMELVPGNGSIEKLLEQGALPIGEALRLGIAVAGAMEYAHSQGVVHRDLKPANILLSEFGEPLVADFGLAHMTGENALTLTTSGLGTPKYMSPEQTFTGKVGPQSDIYSFGLILYEMVTGHCPYDFPEDTALGQVFEIIRNASPAPPRKFRKGITRNLEAVLLNLLTKDPRDRYKTMAAVRKDLQACLSGEGVSVHCPTLLERLERVVRRHRVVAAVSTSSLLCVGGLWLHFHTKLTQERMETILPSLEAQRNAREIEKLKKEAGALGVEDTEITRFETGLAVGRELLVAGDADGAVSLFTGLVARTRELRAPGLANAARGELARSMLAAGDPEGAEGIFAVLAEAFGATPSGHMAQFEMGLCRHLAGDEPGAHGIWSKLLRKGADQPHLVFLCRAALGKTSSDNIADTAAGSPAVVKPLAYWFASEQAPEEERAQLRQQALNTSKDAVPWLFCYLTRATSSSKPPSADGGD